MENSAPDNRFGRKLQVKVSFMVVTGLLALMFLTNPTEKGFQRFFQEYLKTESGSTVEPGLEPMPVEYKRSDYFLFSSYNARTNGVDYHYLGIFGSFHHY